MAVDNSILLYQPYYSFPGHFKPYYHLFHNHLQEESYNSVGLIGISEKFNRPSPDNKSFEFSNPFTSRNLRMLGNIQGLRQVNRILKNQGESIQSIHFLDIEFLLLSIHLSFSKSHFADKRLVATIHSINNLCNVNSPFKKTYKYLIQKALHYLENNFDFKAITNGQFISDYLIDNNFLSPNSIITSRWGTPCDPNSITNNNNKDDNSFLLIGILRKDKKLEEVLESFSKLNTSYHLTIAGQPRDYTREKIYNLISQFDIPTNNITTILRYVDQNEYQSLLKKNKFILVPYGPANLSSSGPLIEGLQYECIPVASAYGERGRIVNDLDVGWTFKYEHKDDFLKALQHALKDKAQQKIFLTNIRQTKNRFCWKNIIRELIRKNTYSKK